VLGADQFAALMTALGPFECAPRLGVAVSGGADSMALCLLAEAWARGRGGQVTALTVDHGLRPESTGEARRVGGWLAARGIEHRVLRWRGRKPSSGLQAAAREARYRLLTSWCREVGVLHLVLAHHMEDQAETFMLRLEMGSGFEGLSAMSAVVETADVRLLRPLLGVPRRRLRATLEENSQPWIEDPSNRDRRFARTRVRNNLELLSGAGLGAARVATTAARLGRARTALEDATAVLLARCCAVYPAGYAHLDGIALMAAPAAVSMRALARVLMCIGGRAYAPRTERLERLYGRLAGGRLRRAATLCGCRLLGTAGGILVCREGRGAPAPVAAVAGGRVEWDGRFVVEFSAAGPDTGKVHLTRLGRDGWAEIVAERPLLRESNIPSAARASFPALRHGTWVCAVPHLDYTRPGDAEPPLQIARISFQPRNTLSGPGFAASDPI
jgi:tRNA(Ile)-lysidine synthase